MQTLLPEMFHMALPGLVYGYSSSSSTFSGATDFFIPFFGLIIGALALLASLRLCSISGKAMEKEASSVSIFHESTVITDDLPPYCDENVPSTEPLLPRLQHSMDCSIAISDATKPPYPPNYGSISSP
jgi:hypothetical protein